MSPKRQIFFCCRVSLLLIFVDGQIPALRRDHVLVSGSPFDALGSSRRYRLEVSFLEIKTHSRPEGDDRPFTGLAAWS
jgi:hypothetical protein